MKSFINEMALAQLNLVAETIGLVMITVRRVGRAMLLRGLYA